VALVFFLNGFVYASWVPRLAEIRAALELSEGQLGIALLMLAIGALVAMPATGGLIVLHGSRILTATTVALLGLAVPPIAFAGGFAWLCLAFAVYGAATGALDVSMNAQGIAVERAYRRPIMSSLHGMFSIGAMSGAGATGLVASLGVGIVAQLVAIGALTLVAGPLLARLMLPAQADAGGRGEGFVLPDRRLLALGAIAFCGLLGEGAMGDWSAVYLDQSLGADIGLAAMAFAVFSLTMALGRFSGDRIVARLGGGAVVSGGGALAALGLGATLLIGRPEVAIVGFGLIGAGLSCIFPVALSAATRTPGMPAGTAIAGVCTIGYLGFLIGPPAIGGLADLVGLPAALGGVVLLLVLIVLLGNRASERRESATMST
jgi:predicted MFS family arabinose efflux permease